MSVLRAQYGEAFAFDVPIPKANSTDFAVAADWTPASGDVKVIADGTDAGDIDALPVAVTGRAVWRFQLTQAKMAAKQITVLVVDAATKAIADQAIVIQTYGHQSAAVPDGIIRRGTAQAATTSSITLDAGASAVDDFYNGYRVRIPIDGGTGAGQERQVVDYNGSTKVATIYAAGPPAQGAQWATTPNSSSRYEIWPESIVPAPVTVSGGIVQAEVVKIAGETLEGSGTPGDPWGAV